MVEYIFFYKDIVVGGGELLIEKISKQIIKEGFPVKILCRTIDEDMLKRFDQSGVEICRIRDWENNRELRNYISLGHEVRMITFFWEDFVRVYILKKRKMKTILYAVHFQALAVGANCRFPLAKKVIKRIGSKCIYDLLHLKRILCMDEQTVQYTQNYFRKAYLEDILLYQVVRVPINIEAVKREELESRARNTDFKILTIARAEFPFKGYMLGLIDFLEKQKEKGKFCLDIISYGPDIDRLKEKIDALDAEMKENINLYGKTDYDALNQYYEHAKVYIGMGTTILDAAQRGIISIPVVPYTEEVIADKFFHEDYRMLAVDREAPNCISDLWRIVRGLNAEEYLELSRQTRNAVIDNYGIEKTTQTILKNFDRMKDDKFNLKISLFKFMISIQSIVYKGHNDK